MKRIAVLGLTLAVASLVDTPLAVAQSLDIGVGAGVSKTQDDANTINLTNTLYLTGNLRLGGGKLVLEPEIGYWSKSLSIGGLNVSASDLNYGANLLLVIPAGGSSDLFGGIGGGAHTLKGTFQIPGLATATNSETKFGWDYLVGLEIKVGKSAKIFGAFRKDSVHTDVMNDNLQETKFYGGLRFHL